MPRLLPIQRADDEWAVSGSESTGGSGLGSQWSSSSGDGAGSTTAGGGADFSSGQGQPAAAEDVGVEEPVESSSGATGPGADFTSGQSEPAAPEDVGVEEPVESPPEATGPGAEFFAVGSPPGASPGQQPGLGANAAPGPDAGCRYAPGEKARTKTEGVGAFGLTVPAPDIFGESTTLIDNTFGVFGFTQGDDRLKELHESFLLEQVGKLGLDTEEPTHRVVKTEGFSDCVDSFSKNVGIRLRRAQRTRDALLDFGALESNVSSIAVASDEGASLTDSQETEEDRANNRAAVCHVELAARPGLERTTPPEVFDPSCDKPSDRWTVEARFQLAGGTFIGPIPTGGSIFTFTVTNRQSSCEHFAMFLGGGLSTPGVSLSLSTPTPPETLGTGEHGDVFARELSGFGELHFGSASIGPFGEQLGKIKMASGALEGQEINVGGFQFQVAPEAKKRGRPAPKVFGGSAQVIVGRLQVFDSPTFPQ